MVCWFGAFLGAREVRVVARGPRPRPTASRRPPRMRAKWPDFTRYECSVPSALPCASGRQGAPSRQLETVARRGCVSPDLLARSVVARRFRQLRSFVKRFPARRGSTRPSRFSPCRFEPSGQVTLSGHCAQSLQRPLSPSSRTRGQRHAQQVGDVAGGEVAVQPSCALHPMCVRLLRRAVARPPVG